MSSIVIRNGTVVTPEGCLRADVRVEDQTIQAIGPELPSADSAIDATGLHIFPATIDVHLHFNEPGRTEWEGAATGSRALAAGGGAVFFDMPLNSTPCTVNAREFTRKQKALEAASLADFGLWGGLIPGNVSEMANMAEQGAIGFKAFLCDSGLPEFPRADDLTLWDGCVEAARLDLPIAVHAESNELARGSSRPVLAELEAIQRATLIAGEAKARLHIVHISCGRGVVLAAEARARGVDVTIETCPHYLFFSEEDVERLGALAKCAPPLRSKKHQEELWNEVERGTVDIIASDHSPAPPEMKLCEFDRAWGGIAGVQSTLAVLLHRSLVPQRIAGLLAANPAKRFRLARKGAVREGNDADLTLVDLSKNTTLTREDLADRHRMSPYAGSTFRGVVRRTMRRGETIYSDGMFPDATRGHFLRPQP